MSASRPDKNQLRAAFSDKRAKTERSFFAQVERFKEDEAYARCLAESGIDTELSQVRKTVSKLEFHRRRSLVSRALREGSHHSVDVADGQDEQASVMTPKP